MKDEKRQKARDKLLELQRFMGPSYVHFFLKTLFNVDNFALLDDERAYDQIIENVDKLLKRYGV